MSGISPVLPSSTEQVPKPERCSDSIHPVESSADPPEKREALSPKSVQRSINFNRPLPPIPSSSSRLSPELTPHRYRMLSINPLPFFSPDVNGGRCKPDSSSPIPIQSHVSPPPRIPTLHVSRLSSAPEAHELEANKHTSIRETPGDISSRYYPEPLSDEGFPSVHFVAEQSSVHRQKKASPTPYLLTRLRRADTPMILQQSCSSSSSNFSSVLSPRRFEETFAEVHLIRDTKKKFSENAAAKAIAAQLSSIGNSQENIELVLAVLLSYHKMKKDRRIEQRWNLLLTAIFLRRECIDLIYTFLQRTEIEPRHFAAIVTGEVAHKKIPPLEVILIISLYTQQDLKNERPDKTLFRSDTLSTALLASYGHYLLTDFPKTNFLKNLEKFIVKQWKGRDLEVFLLNYQKVHQSLLENHKGFDKFSMEEQKKLCAQTIQRNKEACWEFFFSFLTHFYKQPLPAACQDLFSIRRNQIYHFLENSLPQAHEESKKRISADLVLRIINPYLMMISDKPSERNCLASLCHMIQILFNQSPPEYKGNIYPNNLKSREFDKDGALNLSQAQPTAKQLNLNKLSDAGGSQSQWLPTPSKTDFSGCLGIKETEQEEAICQYSENNFFREIYLAFEHRHLEYICENFPIRFSPPRQNM